MPNDRINEGLEYKNFTLAPEGRLMADGRYAAEVTVVDRRGPTDRSETFAQLEFFATDAEAADFAEEWGMRWVDENGEIDAASAPAETPLADPDTDLSNDASAEPDGTLPLATR